MKNGERKYTLDDIIPKYSISMDDLLETDLDANIEIIDENLEGLSYSIGRELTEEEEDEILMIVDEFTPKNEKGNYLVDLLPFDYAWEIYQAKLKRKGNNRWEKLFGYWKKPKNNMDEDEKK